MSLSLSGVGSLCSKFGAMTLGEACLVAMMVLVVMVFRA
jgi:hypothetical protein